MESDFCGPEDRIVYDGWRLYWKLLRAADFAASLRVRRGVSRARVAARAAARQRVLLVAVEVPGREAALAGLIERIVAGSHHVVDVAVAPMAPVGKFDNINAALEGRDRGSYDWVLVIDDDIVVEAGFLDLLVYFASVHGLKLAQPAHRYRSYATYRVTERRFGSLVRRTGFVEIGPVTLIHRDLFEALIPFPSLRWAWGLDLYWAGLAKRHGWRMGVVDAVPVEHLRPVGASYDWKAARREGVAFLTRMGLPAAPVGMFDVGVRIG